jgi:hypothetical protein
MDSAWGPPIAGAVFIAGRKYRTETNGAAQVGLVDRGAPGQEQDLDKEQREHPVQTMAEQKL